MNIELARRALACKHWRWMPGMRQFAGRNFAPYRIVSDIYAPPEGEAIMDSYDGDSLLPDLTDPATLGCLLSLVREAWKSPVAQLSPSLPDGYQWTCYINDEEEDRLFREKTEAEALIAALEAAP